MITQADIKKLQKVFVTKVDLKKEFRKYATRDEVQKMFQDSSDHIVELFSITNTKLDEVLKKLDDHNDDIDNHERRIAKLEDKVFTTTTSPL